MPSASRFRDNALETRPGPGPQRSREGRRIAASILIALALLAETSQAAQPTDQSAECSSLTAAETASSFDVVLSAKGRTARLSEGVWVTARLHNVSDRTLCPVIGSRNSEAFKIEDIATGVLVPRDPQSGFGLESLSAETRFGPRRGPPIAAGETIVQPFRLDDLYLLRKPGTYRITLTHVHIGLPNGDASLKVSNAVVLTVTP